VCYSTLAPCKVKFLDTLQYKARTLIQKVLSAHPQGSARPGQGSEILLMISYCKLERNITELHSFHNLQTNCTEQPRITRRSQDSGMSTGAGLRAGRSRVRIPISVKDFSLPQNVQTRSGIHPSQWGYFPGVNGPSRDVGHSPPSMPRLRMSGAKPLIPLYASMSWMWTTSRLVPSVP
jgi:hypothetical protein